MKKLSECRIELLGVECIATAGHYANNRIGIQIVAAETKNDVFAGEPMAKATINLPEIELGPEEVIIKNVSENKGVYEAMKKAGIVGEPRAMTDFGPICRLLVTI